MTTTSPEWHLQNGMIALPPLTSQSLQERKKTSHPVTQRQQLLQHPRTSLIDERASSSLPSRF